MEEYQTPQKVSTRSTMARNGRSKDFPPKKSNKITEKSLNAAFTSISEDSMDFSPISEICDTNPIGDATTFLLEEASSVTLLPCDITLSTKVTGKTGSGFTSCFGASQLDNPKFDSLEGEMTVKFLRNHKPHILNSLNASPLYKELLDVLIEFVIKDLYTNSMPGERDQFDRVFSAKILMLSVCFFIWIIVLFFISDHHCPYRGPLPT